MRKVTFFCIAIVTVLIVIPIIALCLPTNSISRKNNSTVTTENDTRPIVNATVEEKSDNAEKYIISMAISLCEEDFCDEGIKAVLAVVRNNYLYAEEQGVEKDTIPEREYSDEFYRRIKNLYSNTDAKILYGNKHVYIPTATLSCGFTKESEKYPYITSVASPWDCLNEDFVYGKEYSEGISIEGLNYFCSENGDYKSALIWYLPQFIVT